ncbi:MAG: DUF3160 domain-containing protein [Syntrophomonadaceae bacterium]|jgi:hypothetical protein
MKLKTLKKISILMLLCLMAGVLCGCNNTGSREQFTIKTAQASEFAPYAEIKVDEQPSLKPYQTASDLSNVENAARFKFSSEAQQRLVQNGFVVIPGLHSEYYMLYEINRYDMVPNLVTTDSILHNYHLFFEHLLKKVEEEKLLPELKKLNQGMLQASQDQLTALKGTIWENAARRNLAYFAVAGRLVDSHSSIPSIVQKEVLAELDLIKAHSQTAISPVISIGTKPDVSNSLKEDYTQYIPRGHYTRNAALESYFRAMMWYGRMTFLQKDEDATRSAVLMTLALQNDSNSSSWSKVYDVSDFFVGSSDDPGYKEYIALLKKVYGSQLSLKTLTDDKAKWQTFLKKAAAIKGPAINSIPIFDASVQPDREQEIKGFRFMGQRYTVDADIFQRLIYREVGENPSGERRLLPKGLDIPAAMGSSEARKILTDMGQDEYQNYSQNMDKVQQYISGLEPGDWHKNLYWNWMYTLQPLTRTIPSGYPSFMLNQAWLRKELNTYLSSWTELRHDTILYAKQNYAEMGGGGDETVDDRGYVEPNPHLYARLAALSALTRNGLESRGLISDRDSESLKRMEKLARDLQNISQKELKGLSLSEQEYELIRSYGGQLEHFWLEALRDQGSSGRSQLLADNPCMLVADVATAPPDTVLEEATGYIQYIYAVVPVEGKLRIARGGVYSYYEFPWPATQRLTDDQWREMLSDKKAPAVPGWTASFFVTDGECRITMPWDENS